MSASIGFVKLGSRGLWPSILTVAACVGLSTATIGCFVINGDNKNKDNGDDTSPPPPSEKPLQVSITTGETLEVDPGEGVGVFVEYSAGGHWHVWTACDTNTSGYACDFDLIATVTTSGKISHLIGENLEGRDAVGFDGNSARLIAETSTEFDGMNFDTAPDAIVELDMLLDGVSQPQFVYWKGNGVIHTGAPSNPLDFKPTTP